MTTSLAAAVFYDWITTFHAEVDFFWSSRPTVAALLFLINRYLLLAYYVLFLANLRGNQPEVCTAFDTGLGQILISLSQRSEVSAGPGAVVFRHSD